MKTTTNKNGITLKVINTKEAQNKHEQILKGHWFDKESQRFFKSRWSETAYLNETLNVAFFVSSEQHETYFPKYHKEPRYYTIRAVCMETGQFLNETMYLKGLGEVTLKELEFQRFHTSREAKKCILNTDWEQYKQAIGEWRK